MSTLDVALRWAERGRRVLQLKGKVPVTAHGVCDATIDAALIRRWWSRNPNANLGLTLDSWCVVDVDQRHDGMARWAELCRQHGEPETLTQLTATAGLHYCFVAPECPVKGKICKGIDIITGPNRYIVCAPSLINGGRYRWIRRMEPQPMPGWLVELCRREEGKPLSQPHAPRDRADAYSRAVRYAERFEPAIQGSDGSGTTFRACLLLTSRFPELTLDEHLSVLVDWNERCLPPWSKRELLHKLTDAIRVNGKAA